MSDARNVGLVAKAPAVRYPVPLTVLYTRRRSDRFPGSKSADPFVITRSKAPSRQCCVPKLRIVVMISPLAPP